MKRNTGVIAALLAALLLAVPQVSLADRHGHGGHYDGGVPWWWIVPPLVMMSTLPAYQHYDPQPVIIQQPAPPTVIMQPSFAAPSPQPSSQYWYYCAAPKGYYPYVASCPGGWRPVSPIPPGVAP
jgi:hypothetical protein